MNTKEMIQIKFQLVYPDGQWYYQLFESERDMLRWTHENEIFEWDEEVITIMVDRGEEEDY